MYTDESLRFLLCLICVNGCPNRGKLSLDELHPYFSDFFASADW